MLALIQAVLNNVSQSRLGMKSCSQAQDKLMKSWEKQDREGEILTNV